VNLSLFLIMAWLVALFLFVIIYFGYFLLVYILAKLKTKPVQKSDSFMPFISILIPCYNVESFIDRKIEETLEIVYPRNRFEVIAIESGSEDNTYMKLSKYSYEGQIELIKQSERLGKASAINIGLERCKSDIVVLTDADTRLEKDSVRELVKNFADPEVGAVVGNLTITSDKSVVGKMNHLFFQIFRQKVRMWESSLDSVSFLSGELCAFRKSVLGKLEENIINDDRFILLKTRSVGLRCVCEPLARVYEGTPAGFSAQIIQKRRTTTGAIQGTVRFKHLLLKPKYGFFGMLILPSYLFRVILLPFLLFFLEVLTPIVVWILWFSSGPVWLSVGIATLLFLGLFESGRKLLLSLFYGLIVQTAIFAGITDYILRRRSVLWPKVDKACDKAVW